MAKRGLGKGLNNLIPGAGESIPVKEEKKENKVEEVKSGEVLVRTALIEPNRKQPRKNFDEEAIAELAASIEEEFDVAHDEAVADVIEFIQILKNNHMVAIHG